MAATAPQSVNLSAEQREFINYFLSLNARKQERAMKLVSLYNESVDDSERDEITAALAEVLFRKKTDLIAEPLDDKQDSSEAKQKLQKHREYVAGQIALHRVNKGWTQEELADKAGLPQSHVSRLERCVHAPTYLTLKKLADALGIEPAKLDPSFPEETDD